MSVSLAMSGPVIYRTLQLQRFDPEILANVLSQSKLEHFLLGDEPCDVSHEHWEDSEVLLDHANYSFKAWVRGDFSEERLCIGFIRDLITPCWINGTEVRSDQLVVFAEHSELAFRSDRQTHWVATQITRDYLQSMSVELLGRELDLPKRGMQKYQPSLRTMMQLRKTFDDFSKLVRGNAQSVQCYKDMLVFAMLAAIGSSPPRPCSTDTAKFQVALETAKLAEEFILNHFTEPCSSSDLATRLKIPERRLELQFKRMFGMTPERWREGFGLNMAYRGGAQQARGKVTMLSDMAARCGHALPGDYPIGDPHKS